MKTDDYYDYKYILGSSHRVIISRYHFHYLKYFYESCINSEKNMSVIRLYNKCLRITEQEDHFDKIIFAKTSIEVLINIIGKPLNKKNCAEKFIERMKNCLSNYSEIDLIIENFFNEYVLNNNGIDIAKNNLNNYLNSLKLSRDDLIQDNKVNNLDFITLEVYITWFPLFFLIMLFEDKLQIKDIIRLIFFLRLLQLNFNRWNKRKIKGKRLYPSKKLCLEMYAQLCRSIPICLERNDFEGIEAYIKGFNKYFNENE